MKPLACSLITTPKSGLAHHQELDELLPHLSSTYYHGYRYAMMQHHHHHSTVCSTTESCRLYGFHCYIGRQPTATTFARTFPSRLSILWPARFNGDNGPLIQSATVFHFPWHLRCRYDMVFKISYFWACLRSIPNLSQVRQAHLHCPLYVRSFYAFSHLRPIL